MPENILRLAEELNISDRWIITAAIFETILDKHIFQRSHCFINFFVALVDIGLNLWSGYTFIS